MTILSYLKRYQGGYTGVTLNPDTQPLEGQLSIQWFKFQDACEFNFALHMGQETLHAERAWFAYDFEREALGMWRLNSNSPGVNCLRLSLQQETHFEFSFGENSDGFREKVVLDFLPEKELKMALHWALPHEELSKQSEVLFQPLQAPL